MIPQEPQYTYAREYVSPERAAEFLKSAGSNRPISLAAVRKYTEAMRGGRWDNEAPAMIIFDDSELGRDGQHRLHSAVRADVGFWAIIVRNMPAESFAVIDTGARRTAAQVLAMDGVSYAAVTASAAKYALNYIEGVGLRTSRDNDEVRAFYRRHEAISMLAQRSFPVRKKFGPSPFAAVMFLASGQRSLHKKIDKFISGVIDGGDGAGDPRFMLREWADRELARQKGAVIRPEPLMMATSLAWNAYAAGKMIGHARELDSKVKAHRDTMPITGCAPAEAPEMRRAG